MKKNIKAKVLSIILAMMMVVVFMPTFAFAAETPEGQELPEEVAANVEKTQELMEEQEAAAEEAPAADEAKEVAEVGAKARAASPVNVYFTVYDGGNVVAKDGKPMLNKKVYVTDRNKDGKLTYDEALVALHAQYNKKSNFGMYESGWVNKFWGVEGASCNFMQNGAPLADFVINVTVKKNDKLAAATALDTETYLDAYAQFDKTSATVVNNHELKLKVSYDFVNFPSGETAINTDDEGYIVFGTWNKGSFEPIEDAVIDDDGYVTLKFNKVGTYMVTAQGFVGDYEAPVEFAPVCNVTVTAAPKAKVYTTVSYLGKIAKTNKSKIMHDKSVYVYDRNKDGFLSVDETLYYMHRTYNKYGTKAYKAGIGSYGMYSISKVWNKTTGNVMCFVNGEGLASSVDQSYVEAGDKVTVALLKDAMGNDWLTKFTTAPKESVYANDQTELVLEGHAAMAFDAEALKDKPLEGLQVGTWKSGKFYAMKDAVTDANGKTIVSFSKPGTYYVTATGTVKASVVVDWTTMETAEVDCPVIAPVTKVTVKSAKKYVKAEKIAELSGYSPREKTVVLDWSKADKAVGYKIYRSTKATKDFKLIKTVKGINTNDYIDTSKLKNNKTYYYKVRAYVKEGKYTYNSKYSPVVKVKTLDEGELLIQ